MPNKKTTLPVKIFSTTLGLLLLLTFFLGVVWVALWLLFAIVGLLS